MIERDHVVATLVGVVTGATPSRGELTGICRIVQDEKRGHPSLSCIILPIPVSSLCYAGL